MFYGMELDFKHVARQDISLKKTLLFCTLFSSSTSELHCHVTAIILFNRDLLYWFLTFQYEKHLDPAGLCGGGWLDIYFHYNF